MKAVKWENSFSYDSQSLRPSWSFLDEFGRPIFSEFKKCTYTRMIIVRSAAVHDHIAGGTHGVKFFPTPRLRRMKQSHKHHFSISGWSGCGGSTVAGTWQQGRG